MLFTGLFGLASIVSFQVPNFVQSIGFTAAMAATGVTCVTIGQTGGKFIIGAVNDKFGVKAALFTGIGGGMLGVVVSDSFCIAMLYIGALLLGIGFSGSTLLPPVADTINFSRYSYRSLNIQDIERLPAVPIFLMKVFAFYFISQSCRVSFLTNSSNS